MSHTERSLALAVCGSVIGAGFASGRELMSFFARYGAWGLAGIVCAVAVMAWVMSVALRRGTPGGLPACWRGTAWERVWQGMFLLLMIVMGGAMLSGSGEIAALMLPLRGARLLGMGTTLVLALLLARWHLGALSGVSRVLVVCLLAAMVLALRLPKGAGAVLGAQGRGGEALGRGICYGGFNMALAVPVLGGHRLERRARRRTTALTSFMLGGLLVLGVALMLRHPELTDEPLPTVQLLRSYGLLGYRLCGLTMYMAVLTSLLAALRGIAVWSGGRKGYAVCLLALGVLGLCGFADIVDRVYPVLGAGCCALFALSRVFCSDFAQ